MRVALEHVALLVGLDAATAAGERRSCSRRTH
jgi:hypothetical protein